MTEAAIALHAPMRRRWIDGARGIGILLVVYGHAARSLFSGPAAPDWEKVTDRTIYAFHMPLFFILAGLFVWPSLARAGRRHFAADKLATIVYPYFLWSITEGVLEMALASRVNTPVTPRELAMIPFTPIEQYWFLYVLALCFATALACYPRRWAIAVVAVIGFVSAGAFGSVTMLLRALAFFPFVAMGILAAAPLFAIGRGTARAGIVLAGALVVFAAGLVAGWEGIAGTFLVAVAGSVATMAAAVLLDRGVVGDALALLGRGSLAIYVMHTIFSAGTRIALQASAIALPPLILLAMTVIVGVVGPLCVWLIAERVGATMPLGLGRPVRSIRRQLGGAPSWRQLLRQP